MGTQTKVNLVHGLLVSITRYSKLRGLLDKENE